MGILLLFAFAAPAFGQGTSFTYQGRLTDGGTAANGNYDFFFTLYDTIDQSNQIGNEVSVPAVSVSDGIFSVTLDFGPNAFPGADRFLQIVVRRTGDTGIRTLLSPRQKLTSTPYAIRSLSAATADNAANATQLGGTTADQFVLTGDVRLSDARPPTAGSGNYIQNGTASQPASNFNLTGTGKADTFDANTQFNLGGARVLSNSGTSNLFAGQNSGQANTSGNRNSFFGYSSGNKNTTGDLNSFFGNSAGQFNTVGRFNDFFGDSAGLFNTAGNFNSFFGSQSGNQNTTGSNNTFVGNYAGQTNTTGNGNTTLGYFTNNLSTNLTNATAIGANARVDANNSLVLGSINGVNGATADANVGIGTTTPTSRLHVVGDGLITGNLTVNGNLNAAFGPGNPNYIQNSTGQQTVSNFNITGTGKAGTFDAGTQFSIAGTRVLSNAGLNNFFSGQGAGQANSSGFGNSFFGNNAGGANDAGNSNSFFGNSAGLVNTSGSFNAFFGSGSGRDNVDGTANSFFGYTAGRQNVSGANNAFFGNAAGFGNTNGISNSFFGWSSGKSNTLGQQNTFVGASTGQTNLTGGNNTLLGYGADVGAPDNSNATAIGAQAFVTQANSLVLGAINGINGANFDTNVGIGTPAPSTRLHVVGDGLFTGNLTVNGTLNANIGPGNTNYIQNTTTQQTLTNFNISGNGTVGGTLSSDVVNATTQYNIGGNRVLSVPGSNVFVGLGGTGASNTNGTGNSFFGFATGGANSSGSLNSFFGGNAGASNSSGGGNSFFGTEAGFNNTTGKVNAFFGYLAGVFNATGSGNTVIGPFANVGANNLTNATVIGYEAQVDASNSLVLGSIAGVGGCLPVNNCSDTKVGIGTTAPGNKLHIVDASNTGLRVQTNTAGGTVASFGSNGAFQVDAASVPGGRFNVSENGNVGIGTSAPTTRLHVVSSQNPAVNLETNSDSFAETQYTAGNYIWRTGVGGANVTNGAANKYYIYDINAGQFRMAIDTVGNVGIGTTAPTSKLHVLGDGLFTGNLTVNGNLNGNFSLNTVNASTQYNLGGVRIIANPGTNNFFAGQGTGQSLTTGIKNAFFGPLAGTLNTSGQQNSFFGSESGNQNSTGVGNSFFGAQAGKQNTGGNANSFFGGNAGLNNTTGGDNSYFGVNAGASGTSGSFNAFFGELAGLSNNTSFNSFFGYGAGQFTTSGAFNTFFGQNTGNSNSTGQKNAFFGLQAGAFSNGSNNAFMGTGAGGHNQTGNGNTALGDSADMASGALNNATAVGSRALVSANNSLVLGSINGVNGATADTNVGIGTTAPVSKLHIVDPFNTGLRVETNSPGGAVARFGSNGSFLIDSTSVAGGRFAVSEAGAVVIGLTGNTVPAAKLHVVGDGLFTGNLTVNGTLNANIGPGNANYVQNTTTQQAATNFNISGDGTAGGTLNGNVVNATTQFDLGGNSILSNGGTSNLFAGVSSGGVNTGNDNSFFGANAGESNTGGSNNAFFGSRAGIFNDSGNKNSFFGKDAGVRNTVQGLNTFVGYQAGGHNGQGDSVGTANANTFIGATAGDSNVTGNSNTAVGNQANLGSPGLVNATAIGANAYVTRSNSVVLGSSTGVNGATGDTNVGIGVTAPTYKLQVLDSSNLGLRVETNSPGGTVASFGFDGAFQIDSTGAFGGRFSVLENGNVGIGNPNPADKLNVNGNISLFLGSAGSTQVCQNSSLQLATCSSSLRYKTNIAPFSPGLNFIKQLRPISFDWKQGGMRDIGFGAEDVAKLNPLFVTYNKEGQVEGVKYDRLSTVFVNAFKEQQTQIEQQQEQIKKQQQAIVQQQTQIDALKKLVCADHPNADVCAPRK